MGAVEIKAGIKDEKNVWLILHRLRFKNQEYVLILKIFF